jgi:hypothetical protein
MKRRNLDKEVRYTREEFKDKLGEHLSAAFIEFCWISFVSRRNLAKANVIDYAKLRIRSALETRFALTYIHSIKGFRDRRQVYDELVQYMINERCSFLEGIAKNSVVNEFKLSKLNLSMRKSDLKAFWKLIEFELKLAAKSWNCQF